MKKILLVLMTALALNTFAQNNWDLVWNIGPMPYKTIDDGSEMAIVKAGFDTDQDGWGEFLCAYTDYDSNYICMFEASGDNTYDLVWSWLYPVPANSFAGITVGDLDNNGTVEIITTMPSQVGADVNPTRLWAFEWNGVVGENKYGNYAGDENTPTNYWNFNLPDGVDFRPYSLNIEDIDNDGSNELVIGVRSGGRDGEVGVYSVSGWLSGFGTWVEEYSLTGLKGGSTYSVTSGDLDNDGNKEIYANVWNNFTLKIIECNGDKDYTMAAEIDQLYQPEGIDYGALDGIRVADVNDDGVNELYMAGTESDNAVFIITGISDVSTITGDDVKVLMHLPVQGNQDGADYGKLRAMYVDDPDQDGNLDLMIAGERNGRIYDVEYKGSGDPADSANWEINIAFDVWEYSGIDPYDAVTITPRYFYGSPAGDMDKDGKKEYTFINYSADFNAYPDDGTVFVIEAENQSVGVEDKELAPNTFSLKQNYPNPFNPATTIEYSISKASQVTLKIYDILGNEVAILANEYKEAGIYKTTFNASSLSSGIYFYKLLANGKTAVNKMTLLK